MKDFSDEIHREANKQEKRIVDDKLETSVKENAKEMQKAEAKVEERKEMKEELEATANAEKA